MLGVGAVFLAESVAGVCVEGVASTGAVAGVAVCAIGASTTSAAGSATFSASALASASKQETVASQ